jgi:hypothetical protein
VTATTTLGAVKGIVQTATGVPVAAQRLVFAGRLLEDARTVDDYNLLSGTTVHLLPAAEPAADEPELEPAGVAPEHLNAGMADDEALALALALSRQRQRQQPAPEEEEVEEEEPEEEDASSSSGFSSTSSSSTGSGFASPASEEEEEDAVAVLLQQLELGEFLAACHRHEMDMGDSPGHPGNSHGHGYYRQP